MSRAGHLLCLRNLFRGHKTRNKRSILNCLRIAPCRCQIVPHVGTDQISRHSLSVKVHGSVFGEKVPLPAVNSSFDFTIPHDGSLPLDGAAPSVIDRRGKPRSMATIADLGARLRSFTLEHPDPAAVEALYRAMSMDRPPAIGRGARLRYSAQIETPTGGKELT